MAVTITLCDTLTISADTVWLNGVNVTTSFTQTTGTPSAGCHYKLLLTKTIGLYVGTVTLTVDVWSNAGGSAQEGTGGVTYTYAPPTYGVTVTVSPTTLDALPNQQYTTTFTVKNVGSAQDTFGFFAGCRGPAVATCGSASLSSATLAAGADTTVTLTWTAGDVSAGASWISMTADDGNTANGMATETLSEYAVGLDVVDANPGPSFNRANCLVVAVAPHAANECGDLRITHPLPSVKTYNKVRVPTLIYNWRFATPAPNLAAILTVAASSQSLDSVNGTLYVWPHGHPIESQATSATWPGSDWNNAATQVSRHIELYWGGYYYASGYYDYAFATRRHYGTTVDADSSVGHFIFVNRWTSPFGAGWWLAGFEQLIPQSSTVSQTDTIAWIGGDGSTQLYVLSGTNVWKPINYVAGRDSITFPFLINGDSVAPLYVRHAPHGVQVTFITATGQHNQTIDRLGHATTFTYNGDGSLASLVVPNPEYSGTPAYTFQYAGDAGVADTALSQVTAPGSRVVTFRDTLRVSGATRSIRAIHDPDGDSVTFLYDTELGGQTRILSRTDKRGTVTSYGFGLDGEGLGYTKIAMGTTAKSDIIHTFASENNFGDGSHSASQDSISILIGGPRYNSDGGVADSADTMRVWINQWWQPTQIRDAYGSTTYIMRLNTTYPTLPTRLMDPLGRVETAVYDARGNDSVFTDFGLYVGGNFATTNLHYDPLWDFVTLIDPPMHDSISITYDPNNGNRLTQQDARGPTTKFTFNYANPDSLLSSVVEPGGARDSVTYDNALANLASTITPLGYATTYANDALGRDTLEVAPADTSTYVRTRTVYDVMDRVDSVIVAGDSDIDDVTGRDTIYVANAYDANGNMTSMTRQGRPDSTGISTILSGWVYDLADRPTLALAPDSTHDLTHNAIDSTYYDAAGDKVMFVTRRGDRDSTAYDRLDRPVFRIFPQHKDTARVGALDSAYVVIALNQAGAYNILEQPMDSANTPAYSAKYPLYPNDTTNPNGYTVFADTERLAYDALGRLLRADNLNALIRRSYLLDGLLATDTLKVRPLTPVTGTWDTTAHVYGQIYTYDLGGRRKTALPPAQVDQFGGGVYYGYDAAGHLDSLVDVLSDLFTYSYDARGDLTSWALAGSASGPSDAYTYDLDGNLLLDSAYQPNAGLLRHTSYAYDVADKLRTTNNTAFPYDQLTANNTSLGQLYSGSLASFAASGGQDEIYDDGATYRSDALGNRYSTGDSWALALSGDGACGFFLNMCYFATLGSGQTTERFWYQTGTGRLAKDSVNPGSANLKPRLDFTQYDLSGNDIFESGYPPYTGVNDSSIVSQTTTRDRASYYGADGKLHAVDRRNFTPLAVRIFDAAFDEYRYDALGRRILMYSRRTCGGNYDSGDPTILCGNAWVRRTIWDGMQELGEIQMPADSDPERDVGAPTGVLPPVQPPGWGGYLDLNKYYGSVLYTNGLGVDRPQSIIRNYFTTHTDSLDGQLASTDFTLAPYALIPLWDQRSQASIGAYATEPFTCPLDANGAPRCPAVAWTGYWFAYERASLLLPAWNGTLLEDKADASGNNYRRNRYYDPNTGRFTQEDPAGLAGGINAYGFANGDPVNFADPFGLTTCWAWSDPNSPECVAARAKAASCLAGGSCEQAETESPFAILAPGEGGVVEQIEEQFGNITKELKTFDHFKTARLEITGRLETGYKHAHELEDFSNGLRNSAVRLKRFLSNPELDAAARAKAEELLSAISKLRDRIEETLNP